MADSTVPGSPVTGSPVTGSPVTGSPVTGSTVTGSTVPGSMGDGVAALADRVAASVTACPAVAALTAGPLATYLPGRTVPGVAVREGRIAVSVTARCQPLPDVIAEVRAAVAAVAPGVPADVHIADIELPGPA